MGFWSSLDPTGDNFLGLGPKVGRVIAGIAFAGAPEFHRTDPFGTKPGTIANKVGRGLGGAGPGFVGGFVTGGYAGAIVGAVGGGIAAGTGKTNSTTLSGFGENLGIGVGGGLLTRGASAFSTLNTSVPVSAPSFSFPKLTTLASATSFLASTTSLANALKPVQNILPSTSDVSVTPAPVPNQATNTPSPNSVNVSNPSATPSAAPSPSAPSSVVVVPTATAPNNDYLWIILAALVGLYLYLKKKRKI